MCARARMFIYFFKLRDVFGRIFSQLGKYLTCNDVQCIGASNVCIRMSHVVTLVVIFEARREAVN